MKTFHWIARIISAVCIGFILLIFLGEGLTVDGIWPTTSEWVGLFFFPFGLLVGLLIAWRYELVGGLISIASLATFYLWNYIATGRFPTGPYLLLMALPGVLFVISALWMDKRPLIKPT